MVDQKHVTNVFLRTLMKESDLENIKFFFEDHEDLIILDSMQVEPIVPITNENRLILLNVTFDYKKEVEAYQVDRSFDCYRTWSGAKIRMMHKNFDVGDGDDVGAVTIDDKKKKVTVWVRWWAKA